MNIQELTQAMRRMRLHTEPEHVFILCVLSEASAPQDVTSIKRILVAYKARYTIHLLLFTMVKHGIISKNDDEEFFINEEGKRVLQFVATGEID